MSANCPAVNGKPSLKFGGVGNRPRKQRRTVKQLYGGVVSYNRLAAFARAWKEECQRLQQTAGRGTFVPLSFAIWSGFEHAHVILGGESYPGQISAEINIVSFSRLRKFTIVWR